MTEVQPLSSLAISTAELKVTVLQRDQPGVLLSGAGVISSSDPWRARIVRVFQYRRVYIEAFLTCRREMILNAI